MNRTLSRIGTGFVYFLIFGVILYALSYFLPGNPSDFLSTKPVSSILWRVAFFTHVALGAVALGLGPFQFSKRFRQRRMKLHRLLGKIYVFSILIASACAFYSAWFASTGWVAVTGFALLAVVWFYTTFRAYQAIRQGRTRLHEEWMFRSYAATFAAVTLRIILPVELALFQLPFSIAFPVVAWLCWVPNLLFMEWWLRRRQWR